MDKERCIPVLMVDEPARSGDSGGPVFNRSGQVVGVLTVSTVDDRYSHVVDLTYGSEFYRDVGSLVFE